MFSFKESYNLHSSAPLPPFENGAIEMMAYSYSILVYLRCGTLSCCRLGDKISASIAYHLLWMFPHDKHHDLDPILSKVT